MASRRLYLPEFHAPHRVAMGLESIPSGEPWLERDDGFDEDVAEKRRLLRTHREQVSVALDESLPAQREVLALVRDTVGLIGESSADPKDGPLDRAALLVQEDLCVMQREATAWRLTAANVCFPTRWDLPSKLGQPLDAIHGRVPGYHEELARPADRFFDGMKPGRVFRRDNWSLVDDPALFQPGGKLRSEPNRSIDASNVSERVWIRSEIQTLQRLPDSGAVLFTLRIHRTRLAALAAEPKRAAALAHSLESMSDAFLLYKSFPPIRDAVLGYLEQIATSP